MFTLIGELIALAPKSDGNACAPSGEGSAYAPSDKRAAPAPSGKRAAPAPSGDGSALCCHRRDGRTLAAIENKKAA